MYVKYHAAFGAIFSVILLLVLQITLLEAALIFLASVFLDFDHYIIYVFEKKDANLKKAYWYCRMLGDKFRELPKNKSDKIYCPLAWFHGIEFLAVLAVLSYLFDWGIFILIGAFFHLALDYSWAAYKMARYPQKNAWRHPLVPSYRFIKTRKFKHLKG